MSPDAPPHHVLSEGLLGSGASLVVVYGVGLIVPAVLLWLALLRAARLLAQARRERALPSLTRLPEDAAAAEGLRCVARGVVVPAPDEEPDAPAVRVAIEQRRERGAALLWTETSRELTARPFHLTLASGEPLRVVPDEHVLLARPLDPAAHDWRVIRQRVAEVRPGDEVFVSGVLSREPTPFAETGGYRGGAMMHVLRRAPREPMVISTRPPAERFRRPLALHAVTAAALALSLAAVHGWLLRDHHALHLWGKPVMARLEAVSPGSRGPSIEVRYQDPAAGRPMISRAPIDGETYRRWLNRPRGTPVPLLWMPQSPSIRQIGLEPRIGARAFALIALWAASLLLYALLGARRLQPWYARRKLIELDRADVR